MTSSDSITVQQLKEMLGTSNNPLILDVREAEEVKLCSLPSSIHMPLGTLSLQWEEIPKDRAIVTLCHHGQRSRIAALFLKDHGYERVYNLTGGIHAWATQIDSTMVQY